MDDMTFFHAGTVLICSSLDINNVLKDCFYFLKKHIPLELIEFTIIDAEIDSACILARYSEFTVKQPLNEPIRMSARAWKFARTKFHPGDVVFLDSSDPSQPSEKMAIKLGMPNLSGIGLLLSIKETEIGMVALLSRSLNQFNLEHARLLKLLHDPFAIAMSNYMHYRQVIRLQEMLADDNRYLHRELRRISGDKIIGENQGLAEVMQRINLVAPTASNVLLLGETGVGKEVIANSIHYLSLRRNGPLIKLNCGGIPESLVDSELFGHEKGAFTGAGELRRGRFERAHNGTLFLDEVGELSLTAQVRLLRVLQEKKIERVGGAKPVEVDVRIIAATHRNLKELVEKGKFREDLFYRLNVFPITIPSLRERKTDIPAFVHHFVHRKTIELNLPRQPEISEDGLNRLCQYDWPGNVRELENTVERELIRHAANLYPLRFDDIFAANSLDAPSKDTTGSKNLEELPKLTLNSIIKEHIERVLDLTNGKVQGEEGAAALLNLNPSTLRHRMRKLGIVFGQPEKINPTTGTRLGPGWDQEDPIAGPSNGDLELLNFCLQERAIGQIMALTGRTNRTKFRNNILKPLIKKGWIEMTIPDKPTSSKQKYRLTRKGRNYLKKIYIMY